MDTLYDFWRTHERMWFNPTIADDMYISSLYKQCMDNKEYNIDITNAREWTTYVILFDQVTRHIKRHAGLTYNIPPDFIDNCYKYYNMYKDILTDFEFMFMLMPIRHTHKLHHVKFVLQCTWNRLEHDTNQTIKDYLNATYKRYLKCAQSDDNIDKYTANNTSHINLENITSILDSRCGGIKEIKLSSDFHPLWTHMREFIDTNKLNDSIITISISGGVDSMVCSYLLKLLKVKLIAVHINYSNRDECMIEEQLLQWWCNTILDIPLYIRRTDEINRPLCMKHNMRELYEDYTKTIRFNTYVATSAVPIIMLGHNKDDTVENIMTNIASRGHYELLLGMTPMSTIPYNDISIQFIRPLLDISKHDIYMYAQDHNIPYLVDSTPKWSQRGKIRDIVRPAMEQWNPQIIDGLISMSNYISDMNILLHSLIPENTLALTFNTMRDVPTNNVYWDIVLKRNNIRVTKKTMICLIDIIILIQKNPIKLSNQFNFTLNKKTIIEFRRKTKIFVTIKNG